MKNKLLGINSLLKAFEHGLFESDEIIPDCILDFELFERDENSIYSLQFNKERQTYSIALITFNDKQYDYPEVKTLEEYRIKDYDRHFIINRVVNL